MEGCELCGERLVGSLEVGHFHYETGLLNSKRVALAVLGGARGGDVVCTRYLGNGGLLVALAKLSRSVAYPRQIGIGEMMVVLAILGTVEVRMTILIREIGAVLRIVLQKAFVHHAFFECIYSTRWWTLKTIKDLFFLHSMWLLGDCWMLNLRISLAVRCTEFRMSCKSMVFGGF